MRFDRAARPLHVHARGRACLVRGFRRAVEQLESRVLFATTVFSSGFESDFLNGWTNKTADGTNASTRWGINTVRASVGSHSAFASALQGGVSAASGYQNNQGNSLLRENLSLAGLKVATLSFDYFLNSEAGYDTFNVSVIDGAGARTTLFSESGNFAAAGWRNKSIDLSAFAGKTDLDVEFRFDSDSSVTNEGGGVWIDEVKLTGDTSIPPGSVSGKIFDDANGNRVRDTDEAALPNWTVFLDVNRNGVRESVERSTQTDASGNYTFTNLAPGTYYVVEEIASGYTQTSPGPAGLSSGSAFKIDVAFPDSTLSPGQRAAFTEAANRWAQIIVGDVPDVSDGGVIIDDIRITASAPSIDGRGGVLGQAAPTGFRTGTTLPFKGFMEFDSEDLTQLEADGQLTRVILHEMGHVLGFGTIWDSKGLIQGLGTADPRYIGSNAVARYNSIFSTAGSSVPVEGNGGAGTVGSHWRETTFGNELMTGYLNGGSNPLSAVTVGAMVDLGYAVSYSAADAYSAVVDAGATLAAGPSPYVGDLVGTPDAPKGLAGASSRADEANNGTRDNWHVPDVVVSELNSITAMAGPEPTLLAYAHTVFVDTGTSRTGLNFGNRRANTAPVVGSVVDTPDPVTAGGSVTLTASGVSDADGSVKQIAFYRETNGTAGLQTSAGGDALVGTDTTPSDGFKTTFSTAGLAPATYTYYAQATDNGGAVSNVASRNNTVLAAPPSSSTGASIAGTVFNDLNGNGVKDTGEPALSGWRVYLDANKNGAYDSGEKNLFTGTSGTYSFTGLAAGTYNVREVDQSSWARTASSPIVTVAANASAAGKNFANFKNASIAGRVFNDADRDGNLDTGESGLSGVRVYDDKNGNGGYDTGERTATTDSAGNYTLSGLVAGQRTVRIVLPTGRTLTAPSIGYHRLTPTSGQVITGKHFGTRSASASLQLAASSLLDDLTV